jgi:hypothetical protein
MKPIPDSPTYDGQYLIIIEMAKVIIPKPIKEVIRSRELVIAGRNKSLVLRAKAKKKPRPKIKTEVGGESLSTLCIPKDRISPQITEYIIS